jgi:hypothetical protein
MSLSLSRGCGAVTALAALTGLLAAVAAQASPAPAAKPAPPAPAEVAIPSSVFVNPATPQEGRNPFFPLSKPATPLVSPSTPAPALAIVELELKGISGTAEHRLAIINNRTFEEGEEGTVATNVGRVRLACRQINPDCVRVLLNGTERTLTLRPR